MTRTKSDHSTATRIERRIDRRQDAVFYAGQFLDLDSRAAVDLTLSRLTRAGTSSGWRAGSRPRQHRSWGGTPCGGRSLPWPSATMSGPAGGAYAANLLRLSNQVPARVVFLTDGKPRKIASAARPSNCAGHAAHDGAAGRTTGLVIAGLRFIGRANVSMERGPLRALLSRGPTPAAQGHRSGAGVDAPYLRAVAEGSAEGDGRHSASRGAGSVLADRPAASPPSSWRRTSGSAGCSGASSRLRAWVELRLQGRDVAV